MFGLIRLLFLIIFWVARDNTQQRRSEETRRRLREANRGGAYAPDRRPGADPKNPFANLDDDAPPPGEREYLDAEPVVAPRRGLSRAVTLLRCLRL